MKTIMDAVNELRGDLMNSWSHGNDAPILLPYLCFANQGDWVMTSVKFDSCVCTTSEFNALVDELQNWQPTKKPFSKFERDIELSIFDHNWIVGIIYDSFDTLHEFDIQSLSLRYPENTKAIQVIDLTTMLDSCSSLCQQFECAIIAKLEEERQNV